MLQPSKSFGKTGVDDMVTPSSTYLLAGHARTRANEGMFRCSAVGIRWPASIE